MNCTLATELLRAPLGVAVADIDACIAPVAPGADGLLLLPFFNGERTPDLPRAKGCLLGPDARNTSTGHLLRAAVEGATFALRFGIDELRGLGLGAAEIVLTGGGAASRVWRQIVADVTATPVVILAENEGAAFGAALQALWSLERQSDPSLGIAAVTDAHIRVDATAGVRPNRDNVAAYAAAYRNYARALDHVSPLFTEQTRA
jgi:xylulokinase